MLKRYITEAVVDSFFTEGDERICLRAIIGKCIEKQKDVFVCFIDYVKAIDCVKHDKPMELKESLDIDGKDLRLIRICIMARKLQSGLRESKVNGYI